jgi:hypothetical protein
MRRSQCLAGGVALRRGERTLNQHEIALEPCGRLAARRATARLERCAVSPGSRGEREGERVNLAGAGSAQQPGYDGKRPAGVDEVVEEEHWLPAQLRGEHGRHVAGIPHLAQAPRAVGATGRRRPNMGDAAQLCQASNLGQPRRETADCRMSDRVTPGDPRRVPRPRLAISLLAPTAAASDA